jgi:hypothetical protein
MLYFEPQWTTRRGRFTDAAFLHADEGGDLGNIST